MIDTETFIKNSPFQITHNDSTSTYNLTNATPELLKFQLQEQYRNTMKDIGVKDLEPAINTSFLDDSFNSHLQANLDSGNITLSESVPSLSSTPTHEDDFEIDSFIFHSSLKPSYLNLKVLIENSILDTSKVNRDAILSLAALRQLKDSIERQKETREYLLEKMDISNQFISNFVDEDSLEGEEALDSALLLKIIRSNTALQEQLRDVNTELEALTTRLYHHNMACLVLGYVEDVKLSSASPSSSAKLISMLQDPQESPTLSPKKGTASASSYTTRSLLKEFDVLIAHIAATAVKHNISLPAPTSPDSDSVEARTKWAKNIIDCVADKTPTSVDHSCPETAQTYQDSSIFSSIQKPAANERTLAEYKTALNDLRFSHQFLTKEYEISRENSMKVIQECRRKIASMEKELARLHNKGSTFTPDDADKDREISRLRKEMNLLKIDNLGFRPSLSNHSSHSSSPSGQTLAPYESIGASASLTSLVSNLHNVSSADDQDDDGESRHSSVAGSAGTSNAILRKEFKKIVSDIHDQYEMELSQEKIRRRKLEDELRTTRR